MKKLSILVLSAGTALFSAVPVSVDFSQGTVTVSLDTARAYVGEPWTAASVAGVHRRVARRAARRAYYGDATAASNGYYDGTYYNSNWSGRNGPGTAFGAAAVGVAAGAAVASSPYSGGNYYGGNWGYGAGPAYGAAAVGLPARAAVRAAYYGANGPYASANYNAPYAAANYSAPYAGANYPYYPTRSIYAAGYVPPSYFGPVCNPRFDQLCQ